MSQLAAIILSLLTIAPGRYVQHIRDHVLPPRHRAQEIADHIESAAFVAGVPRGVLTAHWYYESTLNHRALNQQSGAFGIGQLLPGTPWHRGWLNDCARDPYACEAKSAEHAALALRHYLDECGTMLRALTAYRVGHCMKPGPRAIVTMRLAQQINFRIYHHTNRRLLAARLP